LTGWVTAAAGPFAPSAPAPPRKRSWWRPSGCMPSTAFSRCPTGRSAKRQVRATTPRWATTSAPKRPGARHRAEAPWARRRASRANGGRPGGSGDSAELRGWVACLVRPLTDHLAALGNPSWYARFAAQAMTDPAYYNVVVKGALSSPSLVQVVEGFNHCLPNCRPMCATNATSWPATC